MRFKLHMQLAGNRQILPLNYQYPISAWIYRVMANADNEFTRALHESGYKIENGKSFKLFTFSKLSFPRHTTRLISGTDRMEVWARNAWLNVAFQLPEQCQKFVEGLFHEQNVYIGDKISGINMQLQTIEAMPLNLVKNEIMTLKTISPIVIGMKTENSKTEKYVVPTTEGYDKLLINNLIEKYSLTGRKIADNEEISIHIKQLQMKTELQTIKAHTAEETKVKGYHYEFEIKAPTEIIETGLNAGFGSMNSLGFGYCEVIRVERLQGSMVAW